MSDLLTGIRLIDHQEYDNALQHIIEGPDGRRVFFKVSVSPDDPQAYSQVWSGSEWKTVYTLLYPLAWAPGVAMTRLFQVTEDILGWKNPS